MNRLIKVLVDDEGQEIEPDRQYWHWIENHGSGGMVFCTGEYFGDGEAAVIFEEKTSKRGGITCPLCLEKIKQIKSIRL